MNSIGTYYEQCRILSGIFMIVVCGCKTQENTLPPNPIAAPSKTMKAFTLPPDRPRSAIVGALDSFAPVFMLQFNETDRRPIAVLELNADEGLNTYTPVGVINYTNK